MVDKLLAETSRTMVGNNYESKENLEPCTKVYVGGIPFYSTEDDIRSYFEGCGSITEIDCMKFPESGKFRGIAIITFKTEAASERALALDGSDMWQHCDCLLVFILFFLERTNKASPFAPAIVEGYNRIYVGNLAWDITEDDVRNLFSSCNIASIRFGLDKETMEFKGYGHVDFADSESVKTALKLDQNVVCGRPIRISCAVAKKGAVTGSTPLQQKTFCNQLKSEDSKPLEQNTNTDQMARILVRRGLTECGEKGHLSSDCPKKQATDQENPITMSCDVAKNGAITGLTPWQQKTVSNQFKSEDSKPLEQNINTIQPNDSNISEVETVLVSSKIRRRTCYECGEKGHLSSACLKKQSTDQENPITMSCDVAKNGAVTDSTPLKQKTISNQLKSEDSKPLEQSTYSNHPYGNDTSEVTPVPFGNVSCCRQLHRAELSHTY
ncbi:hypothetical protein Leryth_008640 [Lithospermum erythrorhizon]|nr:hypothetical protein Leryth_008640 [Lithospermum erythrorhizon]